MQTVSGKEGRLSDKKRQLPEECLFKEVVIILVT